MCREDRTIAAAMRIDSQQTVAGHPILAIRDLLRRRVFGVAAVRESLDVDEATAARVIEALEAEGYICPLFGDDPPDDRWQTTPKGSSLANAHDRPPISRAEAERVVDEVLARVRRVRDDARFVCEAREVIVFGSYLGDADALNDIDLIVRLRVKDAYRGDFADVMRARLYDAAAIGARAPSEARLPDLARRGVLDYLRAASPYVSLHRENELEIITDSNRRTGMADPVPRSKVLYRAGGEGAAAGEPHPGDTARGQGAAPRAPGA